MNRRRLTLAAAATPVSLLLSACAMPSARPPAPPPPAAPASGAARRVTGTVAWRERMALPPDAELIVRLLDVSRMDAPSITLAEQRIRPGGRQPPYDFSLEVPAERIDPRMRYTVAARVERQGQLLFISDTAHTVLTHGAGDRVEMVLVKAGR